MRLNMQQLGLNEKLLEENGIFIQVGSTASQTYRDTSKTPSTVGRFDHTHDGPNKNQHIPVDMPAPAVGKPEPSVAGQFQAERRPDEPEQRSPYEVDRASSNDTQPGFPLDIESLDHKDRRLNETSAFTTGDAHLDRLAAGLFANDETAISRASTEIEQSPQVQAFEQSGRDLVAAQQREELQQQEKARQTQQGPVMRL